jgi:hypothetical protein
MTLVGDSMILSNTLKLYFNLTNENDILHYISNVNDYNFTIKYKNYTITILLVNNNLNEVIPSDIIVTGEGEYDNIHFEACIKNYIIDLIKSN